MQTIDLYALSTNKV